MLSYLRRIIVLAFPVALQMLLQSLLGMADVSMVSALGEQAVAAVGLAAKIHFLLMVLMIGVATAGSSLIAQYYGARNDLGAQKTLAVTQLCGLVINLPLVVLLFAGPVWAGLINPDVSVATLTGQFLLITAPVLIFTQISIIYESALRATGNTILPLLIGAGTVALNIVFNYIFINGHFGLPEMGVIGAALGTLLARALQTLAFFLWIYGRGHAFALRRSELKRLINLHAVRHFARFATPMVLNYGIWGLGNTVYHVLMGFSGTTALAVMGVMAPLEAAFFATFMGISSACAILIGQALGANDMLEAKKLQVFFTGFVLVLTVLFSAGFWFGKELLMPFFAQLNEHALALLVQTIAVFCLVVIVKCLNMLLILGVLRAGGDNHFCLKADFLAMWAVGLPIFSLAVYLELPFIVLYALLTLEDLIKIGPFILRVKRGYWLKNLVYSDT